MEITAYRLASRYLTVAEFDGGLHHPLIQWWLMLCGFGPQAADEIPWCGAFVNGIAWSLGLPRPRYPARARSWLQAGMGIELCAAAAAWDIVILKRGDGAQPGPDVLDAPGHVAFYADHSEEDVQLLGGNQSDSVCIESFRRSRVLGVRRLLFV